MLHSLQLLVLVLVLLCPVPRPMPCDELGEHLLGLSSPESRLRVRAERYLAAHVTDQDYPRLAEVAAAGDAEVRARLAAALGSSDRHLVLAALFLREAELGLVALGEEILDARLAAWNPRLAEPGATGDELQARIGDLARASLTRELRIPFTDPLERPCTLLAISGQLPLGLTLDDQLVSREPLTDRLGAVPRDPMRPPRFPTAEVGGDAFLGSWFQALSALARAYGVGIESHGLARKPGELDQDDELDWAIGTFVRLAPLSDVGRRSGFDLVRAWFHTFVRSDSAAARRRAARNLAGCGWPGGLAFLGADLLDRRRPETTEALLFAAGQGRRSPALLSADVVRALLVEVDGWLAAPETREAGLDRARLLLAAYRDAGCLGLGGSDLSAAVLQGWEGAPAAGRSLRLALLESMRCGTRPVLARARAVAEDVQLPGDLRWQALATWAGALAAQGAQAAPLVLSEPLALLGALEDVEEIEQGIALLERCEVRPPVELAARSGLAGVAPAARIALLSWWLGAGEVGVAADLLVGLLRTELPPDLVTVLRARARGEGRQDLAGLVAAASERLRGATDGPTAARLERLQLLLALRLPDELPATPDLELDGVLAGQPRHPAGGEARTRLLQALLAVPDGDAAALEGVADAIDTCIEGLYRRGEDALALGFVRDVRRALAGSARSTIGWFGTGWPRPPRTEVEDLTGPAALRRIASLVGS